MAINKASLRVKKYQPKEIEPKWQQKWQEDKLFSPDIEKSEKPFYNLMMFPYPSAEGLHIGNMSTFSGIDVFGRMKRMQGFDVFEPIGLDGFGIHSENYAMKIGKHPMDVSKVTEERFYEQLRIIGNSYDWTRTVETYKPNYYKWTQWLFLQMFNKGLAYRKEAEVNWCPTDKTVLADEQVIDGKCERCGSEVQKKQLEQWFFKITDYADRLLNNLNELDWSQKVKIAQRNWIGKSSGALVKFDSLEVFTTRPDTLFGVTFMVISPEHQLLNELVTEENKPQVDKYLKEVGQKTEEDRIEAKVKTGVFTGSYVTNPLNDEKVPVWVADYVLVGYGTGAIMAVPAHDQRDFEFAKKFDLPVKVVIEPVTGEKKTGEEFRKSIVAVVRDPQNNQILSINWGAKLGGNLLIGGGVEEGEDLTKAAKREIEEETGYKNLKFIAQTEKIHHHYFAVSKNTQREIEAMGILFELEDDGKSEARLEDNEKGKFAVEWLNADELEVKIKDPLHKYVFQRLIRQQVYDGEGLMVDSGEYTGLPSSDAREKIVNYLEEHKLGIAKTQYHLRDWLISRQRYWGAPIPIIYCDKCGTVPVPEEDLPIELPYVEDFRPTGTGKSPLATVEEFYKVKCPNCGVDARRETDVADVFVDSSWYFLRYPSTDIENKAFDIDRTKKWLPVNSYIGGAEHSVLHLLYARFVTMVLHDAGLIDFEEPFTQFRHNGLIIRGGAKMSKSKGNVVNPDGFIKEYGADTHRLHLLFSGVYQDGGVFIDEAVSGLYRFVQRIWKLFEKVEGGDLTPSDLAQMNKAIKKVEDQIADLKFNTAIAALMEWLNYLSRKEKISRDEYKTFLLLLAPFAPHITEELWQMLGEEYSIHKQNWPKFDGSKVQDEIIKIVIQVNSKLRDVLEVTKDQNSKEEIEKLAKNSPKVQKFLEDKEIKQSIYVPGKILNLVL